MSDKVINKGDIIALPGKFVGRAVGISSSNCAEFECITSVSEQFMVGQVYTFTVKFALDNFLIICPHQYAGE